MEHRKGSPEAAMPLAEASPVPSGPVTAVIDGRELHAAVVNENAVRAAAGLTLVVAAVAFSIAFFDGNFIPLQVASCLLFIEFLLRTTAGLRYSPVGSVALWMTRRRPPEWVSLKPKLFAWRLGLTLSFSMVIITNSGIRGPLPRTICIICMVLMWMESALGLCLGCVIYARLVRSGRIAKDPEIERCADGVCALPARPQPDQPDGLVVLDGDLADVPRLQPL